VEKKHLNWDNYFKQASSEAEKPKKMTTKEKWEKAMPAVIRRVGGRENKVRKPEDMVKTFNFRGVEFGNWVDDLSGNFHLVKCAEAFHDLADILKLGDKDISLNGRLAMAFGARGKGKYLAHYEPADKVINITKEGGAGSLAHEWGHAMDNILYQASAGHDSMNYASEGTGDKGAPAVKASYTKLVDAMLKGDAMEQVPYTGLKGYRYHPAYQQAVANMGMEGAIKFAAESINRTYDRKATFNKQYYGDSSSPRAQERLEKELQKIERARKKDMNAMAQEMGYHQEKLTGKAPEKVPLPTGMSQYYVDSKQQGNTDYWTSTREMFARAFETYIEGKMKTGKIKNDYLVHGAWYDRDYAPYPRGEERDKINAAFEELMEAVRKSNSIQKGLSFDLQKSATDDFYKELKSELNQTDGDFKYTSEEQRSRNAFLINWGGMDYPYPEVFYIPVNRLKCDYQTEKALNFDKIRENVEHMKNGESLDPVIIGYDYDVHDGHHRIEASKIMKYTHIPCIVGGSNEILKKRAEEAYSEVWKSLSDRKGEGWYTIQKIEQKHKELGYQSENPPYLTAKAQGDYGRVWAQVWSTGMDWNCYYYLLTSEEPEPKLIAFADDNEDHGAVQSRSKEVPKDAKRSKALWQDVCDNWVKVHSKIQKSFSEGEHPRDEKGRFTFKDEGYGAHDGQYDSILTAYEGETPVGTLDYSEYDDNAYINMIEVPEEHRRKGVGHAMLKELQGRFPNKEINWGMTTQDGTKLQAATTYEVDNPMVKLKMGALEKVKKELADLNRRGEAGEDISDEEGDRWNRLYDIEEALERDL
jgi:ribosomal protein S18 acetylase RimI-like enzyme